MNEANSSENQGKSGGEWMTTSFQSSSYGFPGGFGHISLDSGLGTPFNTPQPYPDLYLAQWGEDANDNTSVGSIHITI